MIPASVLAAIEAGQLPLFVYDSAAARERAALATSLVDGYFYPIKACPEPGIVRAAVESGAGLDLCSAGDVDIAEQSGCPGERWSFTSAHVDESLLRRLLHAGAIFDADSVEQARLWRALGGRECGLRVTMADADSSYGIKFGIPAQEIDAAVRTLAGEGLQVVGLHLHESHALRSSSDMASRILSVLEMAAVDIFGGCRYVNTGGGWPMRNGTPVSADELRPALASLRAGLVRLGFSGALVAEPGEWVAAPCGYWAARVSAVKHHPIDDSRSVVILDTATPVPCRPSTASFVLLEDGGVSRAAPAGACDIFGSANTGADTIGIGVPLPTATPGDIIVSLKQGAYTRQLIGSFNERLPPRALLPQVHV